MMSLFMYKFLTVLSIGWLVYFAAICAYITYLKYWGMGKITPTAQGFTILSASYLVTVYVL